MEAMIMMKKPLILLGVATALGLAAAQAEAGVCGDTSVGFLRGAEGVSFSCTDLDGDTTFSHFTFAPVNEGGPANSARVIFPFDDSIEIVQEGTTSLGNNTRLVYGYTVTNTAGLAGVTLATKSNTGGGTLTTTYQGGGLTLTAHQGESIDQPDASGNFTTGLLHTVVATNSLSFTPPPSRAAVPTRTSNEIINTYVVPQSGVPEPMSLSLLGLGLGGLALVRRRHL